MLKRYWSLITAIVIALLALAIAVLLGGQEWNSYQLKHTVQAQSVATNQASASRQQFQLCMTDARTHVAIQRCHSDQVQAQSQSDTTQYDLSAQQDMARWAYALLWISIFSLVASFGGLILLFISLQQTRTAISNSREIGEAQVRAYLYFKGARFERRSDTFSAIIQIENTGQSPAQKVTLSGICSIYEVGGEPGHPRVYSYVESSPVDTGCQPIPVNGQISADIHFFNFIFPYDGAEDSQKIEWLFEYGNEVNFDLVLKWSDVFGHFHELPVVLSGEIGPSPNNSRKRRSFKGSLDFLVRDSEKSATQN